MQCSFGNQGASGKKYFGVFSGSKGFESENRCYLRMLTFPVSELARSSGSPLLTAIRFQYPVDIHKDWQPRFEEKKLPRHNPFSNHFAVTHEAAPPPLKLLIKRDDVSGPNGALPCSQQRVTGPYALSNLFHQIYRLLFEIWSSSKWCASQTFLLAYPFWLRKIATDPHILAVVYVVCLDDR